MKYKCNFQFSYDDMESKQRLFLGDAEIDLDDSATLLNAKDERIAELEKERDIRDLEMMAKGIELFAGSCLGDDILNHKSAALKYALLIRNQAKALKEDK